MLLNLIPVFPAFVITEIVHIDNNNSLQFVIQLALALLIHLVEICIDVVVFLADEDEILLFDFGEIVAQAWEV